MRTDVVVLSLRVALGADSPGLDAFQDMLAEIARQNYGSLGRTEYEDHGDHWLKVRRKTIVRAERE